ncbi:MAG: hypothetical protein EBT68_01020 [Verrucomicrobia bacterium]|nr:hypothetical protein [Verrucomicrobiota bacterium]NBR62920.1 hypothetical protein [Verrucomicrobiota bacterium]
MAKCRIHFIALGQSICIPVLHFFLAGFAFLFSVTELFSQVQGSAGQGTTKPFTATVALREGYDSNPLTQSYQSTQDIQSSTYTSIQPSLGYNYTGLQADAAVRYDFSGTYYPSINQQYDIQYAQTLVGRYTYAIDPRTSVTLANNFLYTEQPLVAQFVQAGIAPTFNTSTINNLATVQGDYRVTDRLSMITRWNNTLVYLGGGQANNNYMNNGAFQQFRLDFTPETVGTFSFDYQIYDYDNDNTYRDNQQAAFSIGADHVFLPTLFFSGRVGLQLNDNFGLNDAPTVIGSGGMGSGEQEIGVNPFASISATWNYEEKSFVSAGFSAQVQQSNLTTSSDSEAYTLNFNWDHYFTDKFSVIQSFFVNLAVFTPELSQSQTQALYPGALYLGSGQQTTVTYQCKFAYEFYPYLAAELGWSYTSYGSYFDENNGNGGSYTRNQVYVGLRGTY